MQHFNRQGFLLALFHICIVIATAADLSWVPFDISSFPNQRTPTSGFAFFWRLENDGKTVTIGIASKSTGWLAVGLSDSGAMAGADIALFYFDSGKNNFVLEDRFVQQDEATPALDVIQNLKLIQGWQNSNLNGKGPVTAFLYSRRIKACQDPVGKNRWNQEDADFVTDRTQFIIYAFGMSNSFGYHGTANRGSFTINEPIPVIDDSLLSVSLLMQGITVPAGDTQYCYRAITLSNSQPYYTVGYNAIVRSEHVHHIVIWNCMTASKMQATLASMGSSRCFAVEMNYQCSSIVLAWGVGGANRTYASDVARKIGAGTNNQYLLLEIHYNAVDATFTDNSGIGMPYQMTARPNLLGMLFLGPTGFTLLPGRTNANTSDTVVNTGASITVTSLFFHMHKRGRQIWTTIKRNNTETIELGRINHYSFHHQVSQVLVTPFESLVNDSVTTACVFDTSADSAAVSFGYSSNDEMCFNFVEYYPDSQQGLINSGNPPSIAIDTARDSANCDVDPISVVARNFQTDITLTILVALMGLMFFTI